MSPKEQWVTKTYNLEQTRMKLAFGDEPKPSESQQETGDLLHASDEEPEVLRESDNEVFQSSFRPGKWCFPVLRWRNKWKEDEKLPTQEVRTLADFRFPGVCAGSQATHGDWT